MLVPKKVKHRKGQRGRSRGVETRGTTLAFGSFGLKALEARWIDSKQIEASRRAMTRHVQRGGKIWIRIFPDKPITRKAAETGMGHGKGSVEFFVAPVLPGRIIFEIDGVTEELAKEALTRAAHKLPIKTRIISAN